MPFCKVHELGTRSGGADEYVFARSNRDPRRFCVLTGVTHPVSKLIRFVVGPGDQIVPDICATLPGRGLWLSADRNSVNTAHDRNIFSRAARREVNVADDIADQIEDLLVKRCVELIGLARRGGRTVCGLERVRGWLEEGYVGRLVVAANCAAKDLENPLFKRSNVPLIRVLRTEELGRAFGREQVVFSAFKGGGLAKKFDVETARLKGFREFTVNG